MADIDPQQVQDLVDQLNNNTDETKNLTTVMESLAKDSAFGKPKAQKEKSSGKLTPVQLKDTVKEVDKTVKLFSDAIDAKFIEKIDEAGEDTS